MSCWAIPSVSQNKMQKLPKPEVWWFVRNRFLFFLQNIPFPHLIFPYCSINYSLRLDNESLSHVGSKTLLYIIFIKKKHHQQDRIIVGSYHLFVFCCFPALFDAHLGNFFSKQLNLIFMLQLIPFVVCLGFCCCCLFVLLRFFYILYHVQQIWKCCSFFMCTV